MQIKGITHALKKLNNIRINSYSIVNNAMDEVLDDVRDEAMSILRQKVGTGKWGGTWSHGHYDPDDKIVECWEVEDVGVSPGYIQKILKNTSSHAAPVEHGSRSPIKPKGDFLWLGGNTLLTEVDGQRPYHFLGDAVFYNKDTWKKEFESKFYKGIEGIT